MRLIVGSSDAMSVVPALMNCNASSHVAFFTRVGMIVESKNGFPAKTMSGLGAHALGHDKSCVVVVRCPCHVLADNSCVASTSARFLSSVLADSHRDSLSRPSAYACASASVTKLLALAPPGVASIVIAMFARLRVKERRPERTVLPDRGAVV